MKENVKDIRRVVPKDLITALYSHALAALFSFIGARAPIIDSFAPFGVAFAAGVPSPYILSAGLGAAVGYFLPIVNGGAFRYIASIFAVCIIRLLLLSIGSFSKRAFWSATVGFASCAATALSAAASGGITVSHAVIEAVLTGAGAYFVYRAASVKTTDGLSSSAGDFACVAIVINIILLGIYPLALGPISIGRILAAVTVLTVTRYAHVAGGAVSGAVCALFLTLSGNGFSLSAPTLAIGGLLGGIFAPIGKIPCACAFVAWSAISALLIDGDTTQFLLLCENAFGAALFLCIPKSVSYHAGKIFAPPTQTPSLEGLKSSLSMRLLFASRALGDVSGTVNEVSKELKLINAPNFDWVLGKVKDDSCNGCRLCNYCWNEKKDKMRDAVLCMTRLVKSGDSQPLEGAPDEFRERCIHPKRIENAVTRYFREYSSRLAAEARIDEIRGIVSDQFDGMAEILYDLSEEFSRAESFDSRLANRLSHLLRENGIYASDIAAKTDKFGRISFEMHIPLPKNAALNRMDILSAAEALCDRDFEPPTVNRVKNDAFVTLCEKAKFTVSIGVAQLCCGENSVCGDAYSTFDDGKGRTILLLSDGMGTGGRAAVDGAMASGLLERLLKSGFGYDCALKIVNSSMLFKSTDESLATVDISCIDLFTGKAELLKAGAAPTLIRRSGKTGKAQSTSLPAGILRDIGFDRASVALKAGDIVIMMSDGVCTGGTDWICAILEDFKGDNAQALAEKICYAARQKRNDGHDDDITVMAAILDKAV